MNMFDDIYQRVSSGVIHLIFRKNGKRIGSGSAFLLQGYLVTNSHVFDCAPADEIIISYTGGDLRFTFQEFSQALVAGSTESNFDYAVLDIPTLRNKGLYDFFIERITKPTIGREYAVLGFPLDHDNLTIHRGIISSLYSRKSVSVIQLDASVNNGNSGGPLIETTDGGVVGIVTRKNTGLSNTFKQFQETLDKNIVIIEQGMKAGTISFGGFDPNQALLAGQHQLKQLCRELERSANTGIGYAFSIDHLAQESVFNEKKN
jgi:serine protease Do